MIADLVGLRSLTRNGRRRQRPCGSRAATSPSAASTPSTAAATAASFTDENGHAAKDDGAGRADADRHVTHACRGLAADENAGASKGIGPPTCGMGGVPGVTMGHTCMSPIVAAGMPPIRTVGQPGPVMVPPCAVMSPNLAAGFPMVKIQR